MGTSYCITGKLACPHCGELNKLPTGDVWWNGRSNDKHEKGRWQISTFGDYVFYLCAKCGRRILKFEVEY